jgi:uncharacterized protein
MANPLRILSMDGGNGLNTAELLLLVESFANKRFLDYTDIFTGTSAGGINSLYFAASSDATQALVDIKTFWSQLNASIVGGLPIPGALPPVRPKHAAAYATSPQPLPSPAAPPDLGSVIKTGLGVSLAALGLRSLFVNDAMKALLAQRFGDMRLGDLTRSPVVVTSFQLDYQPASESSDMRSWAPKLFTNLPYTIRVSDGSFTQIPNPDMDERIVDVAMRTSAAPLELPIYQSFYGEPGRSGFVDGGLVANNPSMITLAAIVGAIANGWADMPAQPAGDTLKEVLMLSIGTGRNLIGTAQYLEPEFDNGSAAWGYQKWLFDPSNPLVLVDAFLQGGNEAAAFQCRILLGEDNFERLNVPIKNFLVPDDPRTRAAAAASAAWLEKSGWYAPKPPPLPAAPMVAPPPAAPPPAAPMAMAVAHPARPARGARLRSTK